MWTTIRDNLVIEPEAEVDLVEKEDGNPFCSDHLLCGAENYPLSKSMVNHNQERVKAREGWQVSDEVTRDLLEGSGDEGVDRSEGWDSGWVFDLFC